MYYFAESFEYSAISDECYKRMRYRDRLCLKQALHCSYILYNVHVCAYQNLRRVNKSCDLIELDRGIRVILQRTTVGWCIGWYGGGRDEWWRVAMADCNLAQAFFFSAGRPSRKHIVVPRRAGTGKYSCGWFTGLEVCE